MHSHTKSIPSVQSDSQTVVVKEYLVIRYHDVCTCLSSSEMYRLLQYDIVDCWGSPPREGGWTRRFVEDSNLRYPQRIIFSPFISESRDDNCSRLAKVREARQGTTIALGRRRSSGTRQGRAPEGDVRDLRDSAGDMEVTNDRGGTSRSLPKVLAEGCHAPCCIWLE